MTAIDISQYPETIEAFGGNEQRALIFLDRYSKKDGLGRPTEDHPHRMNERVAAAIGDTVEEIGDYLSILDGFKFVPGGRILAGAGTETEVTYYNCYVIPVETKARRENRFMHDDYSPEYVDRLDPGSDSREAIFDTIGLMVDIMSRGGGVGINWSVLRPKGAHLKRVNGTTSGPVSWMDVASRAVGVVEQGGSRRGAAMFMLDDWHPDLMEFINAKRDLSLITNANVSIAVSDAFMERVADGGDWTFEFPATEDDDYNAHWDGDLAGWKARGGRTVAYATVPARQVWRALAGSAWASGEPGVVFLGRYNALSTGAAVERIISVNPCGEQGLGAYSVCNLGAMNLAAYVTPKQGFDFVSFRTDVRIAVKFLDRVVDKNYYFIPENEAIQKKLRRIGLGVMGLADALVLMGIRYGSEEAVYFTQHVFAEMKGEALAESQRLAIEFGPAPAWDDSMFERPYVKGLVDSPLRNLFLLTQAPTGTTSLLAGVNSGIEPFFATHYVRKDRTGEHKVYPETIASLYREDSQLPDYVVTADQVSVEEHIAMQAAAQKYIDSSVSKTINGPTEHTVEDVERAYTLAYDSGLKGLAYFRDGSGRDQVLYREAAVEAAINNGEEVDMLTAEVARKEAVIQELQEQLAELAPHITSYRRPAVLYGTTVSTQTAAGKAYVTVNGDASGRPVELFINVGKAGTDIMELGEAIGRVASLALANGVELTAIAHQLTGVGGSGKFNPPLPHAIGVALLEVNLDFAEHKGLGYHDCGDNAKAMVIPEQVADEVADLLVPSMSRMSKTVTGQLCQSCQNFSVVMEEGCSKCQLCGWTAC